MKKLNTLLLIVLFSVQAFSQKAVGNHKELAAFYKTTTCLVLDDNIFSTYNSAIKEAAKQSWTITPYELINTTEFQKRMNNPKYSFLVRTKVVPEKNAEGVAYTFLTLVNGKKNTSFQKLPEICSFPVSYYNVDYDFYDYKLGALLLFVQNHIDITYNDPKLTEKNILQYYNKNINEIGNKTIYFTKNNLESTVNSEQKIAGTYSGKVKIVDEDEILEAINNKDDNVIIMHIVVPTENVKKKDRCYKMLVGASDGKLYYFDYHKVKKGKPGKFLKKDFSKLNKK